MKISLRREASRKLGQMLQPFVVEARLKTPRPSGQLTGASVHVLTSSRLVGMCALALRSLEIASGLRWPIWIHDDGTLGQKDADFFRRHFEGVNVVFRKDIEDEAHERLAPWPTLVHMRKQFPVSLKIFDPWLRAPHDNYLLIDTDVLFLRRPTEILSWAQNREAACYYNEDPHEVYGLPRPTLESSFPFPIWPKVNTGLLLCRKEAISPELSSEFLTRLSGAMEKPFFLDQVLLALNVSRYGKGGPLPSSYRVHWGGKIPQDTVSCHLVGDNKWTSFFLEAFRRFPKGA